MESLEGRHLLATVAVNAASVVRAVNTQLLGVNLAWWDSNLNTSQTQSMVQAAGLTQFRFPGGSSSDDFHFNNAPSYNGQGTYTSMASFASGVSGSGVVTLDYGSGSPQEAAALLAYFNGSTGNTTAIGTGIEWNDSSNAWQSVDWKTAGYWASLRASAPLAHDDGLNFLRVNHAAPFAFHYYEVGNEEYGSWEIDHHGTSTPTGASTGKQHDPVTYVAFAKQFATLAAQVDSTISIGVDAGSPGGDNYWIPNVLQQAASQGLTVGFVSDHNYVGAPGAENDTTLLYNTVSNPNNQSATDPYDWALRASGYQAQLKQYLGTTAAAKVELLATEFNSVYSNPGKQTTSLVNGLFLADSLGSLLETPYNGADVWDLRNSYETGNNNSSNLYGWRQGGDYGLIGSPNGSAPASGAYTPYPTYFAEQLASKIIQAGGNVISVTSGDANLAVYGVLEANGDLELLAINKSSSSAATDTFQISGYQPAATAQVWQYGESQDTAQSQTTDGHSSLAHSTISLGLSGSSFTQTFPAYSMTVLDLGKAATSTTLANAGFESPSVGSGAYNSFAYNPAGAGWAFSGYSGISGSGSGFTSGSPAAPEGSQVAFLQMTGSFSQMVANVAAGTYQINFSAAQRANAPSRENFQVSVDGQPVGVFMPGGTAYASYSTSSFTVAAGSHTIAFQGLDSAGGDNTAFLDAVGLASATPPTAPSFSDAGFELPPVGSGTYSSFAYDPTGTAWAFSGYAGISGAGSGFTSGSPGAPEGAQVAFLQNTGSFSQSVSGFAAGTYQIRFGAAQRANVASHQDFRILVDGVAVATFTPTGTAYASYSTASLSLTAGAHTIAFQGLDSAGGDNTAFLDNIQIVAM